MEPHYFVIQMATTRRSVTTGLSHTHCSKASLAAEAAIASSDLKAAPPAAAYLPYTNTYPRTLFRAATHE